MAEGEEELKSLLMKVKEESEKAGLKLNIQNRGKNGNNDRQFSWAHKSIHPLWIVTAAMKLKDACSFSYDKPSSVLKKRHHPADKGPYSQSYGFSSSHVQCENWTIKKAVCQRIDAFKLWY